MSRRLSEGGRWINRAESYDFSFNGTRLTGYRGDTLASALLANDQVLMGRSFKYHRPRGVVTSGSEEPNALFGLGEGGYFEPNCRATTTELDAGLSVISQNHWPSLEFDVGSINNRLSRFFSAGFYYKMFMHPRSFWKHIYEPIIRQSAGLGRPPEEADADRYEHFYGFFDVVIIGGGVAGIASAEEAARSGARILLMEQSGHWGGRAPVDGGEIEGLSAEAWVETAVERLAQLPNVTMRSHIMAAGVFDHGYILAHEKLTDYVKGEDLPRERLWKIRAKQIVSATGAMERPLAFAGNDKPGVMLASAMRDYAVNFAVAAGDRVVVVTNNDDAYRTAIALHKAGVDVPLILDARKHGGGVLAHEARELGIRIEPGKGIAEVKGSKRVSGVAFCRVDGAGEAVETIACDAIAMSGGWSPLVHLWSHCGGKLNWDEERAMFVPDPSRAPVGVDGEVNHHMSGSATGVLSLAAVLENAAQAGREAARAAGFKLRAKKAPQAALEEEAPISAIWMMPRNAGYEKKSKAWLDFQNDVKVSDIELAAREGFESVEHAKRYTTLGMATDQGKLSNINGLAILSNALGQSISETGTTTFRPPYVPISMGSIAGEARGDIFQPLRRTALHSRHEARSPRWEPVGQWRRPYSFPEEGESIEEAVCREIKNTRNNVGLLDASTLGKILVKGPDAGRFMDMLYTNKMSTLKSGRCRYGLMCSENGFLVDDGVAARIDEETFLAHTTSGGAERIHAHMEEWLQTEWWDWKVYTTNVTEQFVQIAVVGPKARKLLEKLGGMDVSDKALPFMGWVDGELAGFPVRIYRISFSGELSFEIAIKANYGGALWDTLYEAGREFGVMPYGTEALHVMRAEVGFIMIGDETDGTVIPQDLGLDWAISKKKDDYIGKRAQERAFMQSSSRWKLVGLETEDGSVLPDGIYAVGEGKNANGQRQMIGRVTSSYYSPMCNRGIAMGLVENGPERMGETVQFAKTDGGLVPAKIVEPVFYRKEDEHA